MHEATAPTWIQAESGRPKKLRSGGASNTAPPAVVGPDVCAEVTGDCAGVGGGGDATLMLLTATPPQELGSKGTTIDGPGKRAAKRAAVPALASARGAARSSRDDPVGQWLQARRNRFPAVA